jgi:DHA2 family multidrug resistance protein
MVNQQATVMTFNDALLLMSMVFFGALLLMPLIRKPKQAVADAH